MARTLPLGTLHARAGHIVFEPASDRRFEARVGDELRFVIPYAFAEASLAREAFRAHLTIQLEGVETPTDTIFVDDLPVVRNESEGELIRRVRIVRAGDVRGTFVVEASYDRKPWTQPGPTSTVALSKTGDFLVRVSEG